MIDEMIMSIWRELCLMCSPSTNSPVATNSIAVPSKKWTELQFFQLLQQYPSGISRSIVLTELEYKWRVVIKRGEYSGKLKQAMSTLQLPLYDIIVGTLAKLDEYRISISSEGAECAMIMHRQLSDWGTFLQTCGVDALAGRLCTFTHCRFLKMKPPVLLPTPLACFQLRMSDAVDSYVVQDVCLPSHEHFYATHCCRHNDLQQQHQHSYTQQSQAPPLSVCVPDNNETFIILVEVLGISDVSPYSVHSSGSTAGCTATFRVVTLLVRSYGAAGVSTGVTGREWIEQQSQSLLQGDSNNGSNSSNSSDNVTGFRVVHLILLDDQVHLSDLWSVHDLLLIYRPFIRDNSEERLYGGRAACDTYTSMGAIEVVTRPDMSLSEFFPPVVHSQPSLVLPYHFLYGSVTLISKVIRDTATAAVLASTVAPAVVSSSGNTTTMQNQNQQQQHLQVPPQQNNSGGLRVGEVNACATGRVVGIYLLPVVLSLPEPTATQHQQTTLSERNRASYTNSINNNGSNISVGRRDEPVFFVTELWIDPLASSSSTSGSNGGTVHSHLLRIRFQCSELPSRSPHLAAKVSHWLQAIRDTGRAHPLHSTAFEYGHKVFSIGHLVHFTDLHVLDACEVVESYNPTANNPTAHNHLAAAMSSGTVPSQVQRTPHAPHNVSLNAPLNAPLSTPSTQLAGVTTASQSHKPSMFLKSAMGRQEPGPLAILMYIKNNRGGGGGSGGGSGGGGGGGGGGGSGSATLLTVPATHVLNCTVGSSIKHLYLFPVHSATLQMQLTQHTQQHTQQLQQTSVLSSGSVISNPPIVLPLDLQLGAHSSLYSSGAAAPLMLNVSKITALTGSPSLYMPHSVAELAVIDTTHRTGNSSGSGSQVTVSCVFVVASICKLGDGVRLYHPAGSSNNKPQINNGHNNGHNSGHDSIGGSRSVRHETCYQLVRLRDVNGHELICLIDGTVTTSNCANGHGGNSSGSNSNSGHGASPLKKPRTTLDHTQPQPGLTANNSGNSDINGYTTQVFTHNVINITSSIYFDSSNGSMILPSTTSNNSAAGNRSVESTSSKLFAFILSRIEDVAPMAPKNNNNNGKPLLVPKFRIEVMNEVNLRGLEAEEQRQKQVSAAAAAVTMTV